MRQCQACSALGWGTAGTEVTTSSIRVKNLTLEAERPFSAKDLSPAERSYKAQEGRVSFQNKIPVETPVFSQQ